jgi:hypothetical protein
MNMQWRQAFSVARLDAVPCFPCSGLGSTVAGNCELDSGGAWQAVLFDPAPETMCHRLQLDWSTRGSTSSAIVATALGQLWPYPVRLLCTSGAPWQVQSAMKIGARVAVAPKHGESASAPRILACRIEGRCHRIVRASMKLARGGRTQHMCPELVRVELAHYLPPILDNCDRRCAATGHGASTTPQQKVRICSGDSPG